MFPVSTELDDPRFTAFGLFAEAYAGLTARFAAQLEEHRLSAVEFEVLMSLARSPGSRLRMTDLAGQTSLSTSGVTRVVDRMDRAGLGPRRGCPRGCPGWRPGGPGPPGPPARPARPTAAVRTR